MIRIHLSTRLGERKWTQADLARMTGIRPNTINDLYDEFSNKLGAVYEDCDMIIIRKDDLAAAISRAMGTPEEDIPQIGTAWVKENTGVAVWMPEEGKEYQEYDLFTVCYWGSKALEDTEKAIHDRLIAESDGL